MEKTIKKALVYSTAALLIISTALLIKEAVQVLLLVFAGILLSVFFRGMAGAIRKIVDIKQEWAVFISIVLTIIVIFFLSMFLSAKASSGYNEFSTDLPKTIERLSNKFNQYSWGEGLIQKIRKEAEDYLNNPGFRQKVTGIFSSLLSTIMGIVVVLIIGLYGAFTSGEYSSGFKILFPKEQRERVGEIIFKMEHALQWWLVGQFSSMFVIGVLTAIGLLLLDVTMAVPLGILAALLTFIPNLGPILSTIPAVAIAFTDSSQKALYVLMLYIGIQALESYLITPQIQKRAVSIAPVLLLSVQLIISTLLGMLGLILATPIMVVVIIFVQTVYVQDTLHDDVKVLGE